MREQFDLILDSLQTSWFQIAAYPPRVLTAIVLPILGWLTARTVQRVVVRLLRLARLEAAAEQTGVDDFLVLGGVRFTVVTLIGESVYWGLLLIFAVAVFILIGLTVSPAAVACLTSYVPNVMAA